MSECYTSAPPNILSDNAWAKHRSGLANDIHGSLFPMVLTCLSLTGFFAATGTFLMASDGLRTVKGTPYLAAGFVIFWAGVIGMGPGAGRLAGEWRGTEQLDFWYVEIKRTIYIYKSIFNNILQAHLNKWLLLIRQWIPWLVNKFSPLDLG